MSDQPKRRGRPRKGIEARGTTIGVRVNDREFTILEAAAEDIPLSTWLREIGLAVAITKTAGDHDK